MLPRITDQMLSGNANANLQLQLSQLATLQQESSSGKAIQKPSDNPTGIAQSLALGAQQSANAQYASNATDGTNWLNSVNGALTTTTTALQSLRTLAVEASNAAAQTPSSRASLVAQMNSIKSQLISAANTTYLGRPVFAGNSSSGSAFNSDYSYNGVAGSTVTRRIDSGTAVPVSGDGAATFGTGSDSVFALIDNITSAVTAGTDVNSQLAAIDSRISAVTNQQAITGSNYTRVQTGAATLTTEATNLTTQKSNIDNVDITKTILELTAQQNSYQAALDVTSKALQPTLISLLS
ncbi:MAG TPA: flagellar hook-associated protein FlgL [Galbitalea sp.]|jgi:flagellar hook-associated protein 3 FlgL